MNKTSRTAMLVVTVLVFLAAGCDQPSEQEKGLGTGDGRILLFDCPGAVLEAHFLDEAVQFAWEGRSYRLPERPTKGIKDVAHYALDEAEVISRGRELSVRLPGMPTMTCQQLQQDAVPRNPSLNPTDPPQ